MNKLQLGGVLAASTVLAITSCKKDHGGPINYSATISVENVLSSKPLVESGAFQESGESPLIFPGQSVTIHFSAAKGETISFATMYGWSNDLFFAPENPGIAVYDGGGNPLEGDVSSQIKLWDNGTRINQAPGVNVNHPGTPDNRPIMEVIGTDAQGNTYLQASQLVQAMLKYDGNSYFTLTIKNNSGGTANETPLSPGVWSVSYIVGGNLLNPSPLYTKGQPTANGLTAIAEAGNNQPLSTYISSITGIFTPLSPVLVVVYNGIPNPIYKIDENDRNEGLKDLAQKGNPDILAAALKTKPGVKAVYTMAQPTTRVLLPIIGNQAGGNVSQTFSFEAGDRVAIATMYGFSNDWFFASKDEGVDPLNKGDISNTIALYDDGTALNQFPGAGITQFNLAGTPLAESKPIVPVPNPNEFTTLPEIKNIIHVTIH
ncbi:MAG TPA: spondin domain-containing protein [Chitinophagaceae bacterium]|jgi:hypothetical protein|nr:spondin domain-containing protein [Chitinophagaceae bacterium]